MTRSTEVRLARYPVGMPTPEDFEWAEVDLPDPVSGEVEVENLFLSVDPYMRSRMSGRSTYIEPFALGAPMTGGAVGRVLRSASPDLQPGDLVLHDLGWRTLAVLPGTECRPVAQLEGISPSAYLGVLGMPGMTAYVGLRKIAALQDGDVVFVSAASGAVGTAVGQFARLLGASRVIGSAGSADKCERLVTEFGFDATFNYRDGDVLGQLREAAPDGVDVYFDNVGGEALQAAWTCLRPGGRVAICGAISEYNGGPGSTVSPLNEAIERRLTLRGFLVFDHPELIEPFESDVTQWLASGQVHHWETVFSGIESAAEAFVSLFTSEKLGKVVVAV